jgi:hypothetical protein
VVAVRVITELTEHPGAEDLSQPGLGPVDLNVRVPAKWASTCSCRELIWVFRTVITATIERTVAA